MNRSLCLLLVVAACKGESGTERSPEVRPAVRLTAPVTQASPPAQTVPAGSPLADQAMIRFAIYHLPRPKVVARAELERLVKSSFRPPIELVTDGAPTEASHILVGEPPIGEFRPPDADSLRYFGRGLSPEQVTAVQGSEHVIIVELVAERARMHQLHRSAMEVMLALARRTGGLVWDEETRELYTPAAFEERMVAWKPAVPLAAPLFTTHSFRDGEGIRMVTLGLGKLALPDLVVNDVAPSSSQNMGLLIQLVAQTMVQGGQIEAGGLLEVDSATLSDEKPARRAKLALVVARHEEGDPEGRLWEIEFPGGPPSGLQERQHAALTAVFGTADKGMPVDKDDPELAAASRRARTALLTKVKKKYQTSWSELDHLLVKAPFRTDDGENEYMWLDVVSWKGRSIDGILQNEPGSVSGLKAGARVTVEESSIFDYAIKRADGTSEGNETDAIVIRRQQGP